MRFRLGRLGCPVALLALHAGAARAPAQDVEPRAMTPAPVGTNIVGLSLAHSWGEVLMDKALPVQELDGSTYSLIPSYTRFINLFGHTGRLTAAMSFATGDWDAFVGEDSVEVRTSHTGLGDGVASMLIFLVGAPAMTPTEFRNYRGKTIVGFNIRLRVPIGQYDPDKLINLGSNRWHVAPALGVSHRMGKWSVEGYAAAWFFTENTAFLGDNTLSQNPLYVLQLNLGYRFKPRLWLSLGARQSFGGKTSVNGVEGRDPNRNTRLGLVLGIPIAERHTVRLIGTSGPRTTTGNDFNTLIVQWFYAW